MLLFHAYDSMMFIFLHIIMMRMEGTGTRDGGGKQRADAHWTGDKGMAEGRTGRWRRTEDGSGRRKAGEGGV